MSKFINGKYRILYIKKDAAWFPIGCLKSNGFSESSEMLNTTTRDNVNGWSSSIPVTQSYSISFDGVLTQDQTSASYVTYSELRGWKRGRTLIEWKIEDPYNNNDTGYAYISDLSTTNSFDEHVTFSGTLIGSGFAQDEGFLLLEDGNFVLLEDGFKIIY